MNIECLQVVILHHATTIREGYQAKCLPEKLGEEVSRVLALGIRFFFVFCSVLRVNVSHIARSEILALHAGLVTRP